MSYLSIRDGQIIRHTRRKGQDFETPLPTLTFRCETCQWDVKALRARKMPDRCICGGKLQGLAVQG